jgi:hypothetical protein
MAIKPLLSQQQRVTYGDEEETKLAEPVVPGVKEDQPQTQPVSDGSDVQVTPIIPGDTSAMGPAAPVAATAPEPVVPETEPSVANVDGTMAVAAAPAAVAQETNIVKRMIDMIKDNVFKENKPLDQAISYAKDNAPDAYTAMDGSNSQQLARADAGFTKNPPKTEDGIQAASVVKGFKIAAQHRELGDEGLRQQIESDDNPLDRVAGNAYLTALALGRPPWKAAEDAMKAHQTAIAKTAEVQAKVYEDRQVIEQQAKQRAKAVATNTAATERAVYKKASSGFYKQPGGDGGAGSVPAAKIAQGLDLIKVGIETGDFASAREQLTAAGLGFMTRDLDAAESRYNDSETLIRGTSLKSGRLGPTSTGELFRGKDNQYYRETIVNGRTVYLDTAGRQVSPETVKTLGLEQASVYAAGAKEWQQSQAKTAKEYDERVNNKSIDSTRAIAGADRIIERVGNDPEIVGILKQNGGAFNALLASIDTESGQGANARIGLPVTKFLESLNLTRDQKSKLESVVADIAQQRLTAQQALRGLGAASNLDAQTAWNTVSSTTDTAKGLIGNQYLIKETNRLFKEKADDWNRRKFGQAVPDYGAFETEWQQYESEEWKKINKNIAGFFDRNEAIPGYEAVSENVIRFQRGRPSSPTAPSAPAAPSAPGSTSNKPVGEQGTTSSGAKFKRVQ